MKTFIYTISLLFFLSCNTTSKESKPTENTPITNCDCSELLLDTKYNRFYLTDKKQPFTGHCIGYYPNSKDIQFEKDYVDGKYHGQNIEYYKNGHLKSILDYKNHFMNGSVKNYDIDGKLISHSIYKQSTFIESIPLEN